MKSSENKPLKALENYLKKIPKAQIKLNVDEVTPLEEFSITFCYRYPDAYERASSSYGDYLVPKRILNPEEEKAATQEFIEAIQKEIAEEENIAKKTEQKQRDIRKLNAIIDELSRRTQTNKSVRLIEQAQERLYELNIPEKYLVPLATFNWKQDIKTKYIC